MLQDSCVCRRKAVGEALKCIVTHIKDTYSWNVCVCLFVWWWYSEVFLPQTSRVSFGRPDPYWSWSKLKVLAESVFCCTCLAECFGQVWVESLWPFFTTQSKKFVFGWMCVCVCVCIGTHTSDRFYQCSSVLLSPKHGNTFQNTMSKSCCRLYWSLQP